MSALYEAPDCIAHLTAAQHCTANHRSKLLCTVTLQMQEPVQGTDLLTECNLLHVRLNILGQVGLASSNGSRSTQSKVSCNNA